VTSRLTAFVAAIPRAGDAQVLCRAQPVRREDYAVLFLT
jgi:hypothetical protein